jgi:hypothetical protein
MIAKKQKSSSLLHEEHEIYSVIDLEAAKNLEVVAPRLYHSIRNASPCGDRIKGSLIGK